jgi:hypothetical protein
MSYFEHDLRANATLVARENRFSLFQIMLGLASLYTERLKKAGKIVRLQLIYRLKGGEIEIAAWMSA